MQYNPHEATGKFYSGLDVIFASQRHADYAKWMLYVFVFLEEINGDFKGEG